MLKKKVSIHNKGVI